MLLASDDFNRSNGGLGGNWTTVSGLDAPQISSNVVTPLSVVSGSLAAALYTAISTWDNDHESSVVIAASASPDNTVCRMGPIVRGITSADTFYWLVWFGGTTPTGHIRIRKHVAGVASNVVDVTGLTINVGDTLRLRVRGSELTGYVNNVVVAGPSTDTALTSGSPGLGVFEGTDLVVDAEVDNWQGFDLVVPTHVAIYPLILAQ